MGKVRVLISVVLLALLLGMIGCQGGSDPFPSVDGSGNVAPGNSPTESPESGLAELNFDFLNPPPRFSSDTGNPAMADGSDFMVSLPNSNVTASYPVANYSGDFSYAIYGLEHSVTEDWLAVYLEYDSDPTGNEVWVGLSNYEGLHWDWCRADEWYNIATFEGADKYKSPAGITYVAIVGWNAIVSLRSVAIDYTYGVGGGNISIDWGDEVGEITGRGKWAYDTRVPAHSNRGDLHPTWTNTEDGHTSGKKWQCVEYCERFIWRIWNIDTPTMGSIKEPGPGLDIGAWKWYYQPLKPGMTQHPNGGSSDPPKPGDVVVWAAKSSSNAGHVAVIKAVNLNEHWAACVQQNVYQGSYDGWYLINVNKIENVYQLTSTGILSSYTILGWIHYGNFIQPGADYVETPTGFRSTALAGKVRLDWDSMNNINNYILTRDGVPIYYPPGNWTYYEDQVSGLGPYTYTLVAQRNGQCSSPAITSGSPLPPPLDPPTGVSCSKGLVSNAIVITWNSVVGASSYNIYADGDSQPKFTGINATSYTDTLASNGNGHYYRVRAVNASDLSDESGLDWGWAGKSPLAALTSDKQSGTAPLTVQFDASGSHDLDGQSGTGPINDFEWDFDGDGNFNESSSSPVESTKRGSSVPSVTFNNAITYQVRVRVTDDDGVKATSNIRTITVSAAAYSVSGTVTKVDGGGLNSTTLTLNPGNYQGASNDTGAYMISSVPGGTYTLTPTKTDWSFNPTSLSVIVSNSDVPGKNFSGSTPPIASLTANPINGPAPLNVSFDASTSNDPDGGSIAKYEWDWENDGTYDSDSGNDATVTHVYSSQGAYTCRVRVTDNEGDTAIDTVTIGVNAPNTYTVSGTTSKKDAGGLSGVNLTLDPGNYEAVSGADGTYSILSVPNGNYTLTPVLSGWTFNPVELSINVNNANVTSQNFSATAPPIASMTATPDNGPAPLTVNFDGGASNDPDGGSISKFEWDWTNNGSYDLDSGNNPTATYMYSSQGNYTCKLRITDNEGVTATTTASITVTAPLTYTASGHVESSAGDGIAGVTMSFTGGLGSVTTDASGYWERDGIQNGTYTVTPSRISFIFSPIQQQFTVDGANQPVSDFTGVGWYTIPVDSTGYSAMRPSMEIVQGNPALSYIKYGSEKIMYVRATDSNGLTWSTPIQVASGSGYFCALMITNQQPAVIYHYENSSKIRYVRSTDLYGNNWSSPVDATGMMGLDGTGMTTFGPRPATAYTRIDSGAFFCPASDENGNSWGTSYQVTTETADMIDLEVAWAWHPCVAYYNRAGYIKYAYASHTGGISWLDPVEIDYVGDYPSSLYANVSLEMVDSYIALCYYDYANGDLKYRRSTSSDGSSWSAVKTIYNTGNVGRWNALAVINGYPAVCFFDSTNSRLLYSQADSASGNGTWQAPIVVTDTNCVDVIELMEVNDNPAICFHDGSTLYYSVYF